MRVVSSAEPAPLRPSLALRGLRYVERRTVLHPARIRLPRALVSFSFDDAPASALEGAAQLERAGGRGTFYISGSLTGGVENGKPVLTADEVRGLHARGHEIGCHGHGHRSLHRLRAGALAADLDRNARFFADHGLSRPTTFAYPFGDVSLLGKIALKRRYVACRGTRNGVNAGRVDLGDLRVTDLHGVRPDSGRIAAVLDEARRVGGWVIFYTHDVEPEPAEWGCTPAVFRDALGLVGRAGLEIVTIAEALRRAGIGTRPGAAGLPS
ncbi:MAG: polysaccharide deacetylase family protein [Methylobacterium frigidaeris]